MAKKDILKSVRHYAKANNLEVVPDQITGKTFALCIVHEGKIVKQYSPYCSPKELNIFIEGFNVGVQDKEIKEKPKTEVYLLYEGDEWLSISSQVLMGIFTNDQDLKKGCEELVRSRADRNFTDEDRESFDTIEDFVEDSVNELMSNRQLLGYYTSFMISQVATNVMNEI